MSSGGSAGGDPELVAAGVSAPRRQQRLGAGKVMNGRLRQLGREVR